MSELISTFPPTITTTVSSSGFPLKTTTICTTTSTTVTTTVSTAATVSTPGIAGYPKFSVDEEAPADHHFYNKTVAGGEVPEKISRQWHLLDADLPDSISVRAYRSRFSLLRAGFVGGPGTPYQNLLFFFDFYLPRDFPASPPQAYFRVPSFRINPNLLPSGLVTLDILNTWVGNTWKADKTILEVLRSIQDLFKDTQPYFAEPMFAHRRQTPSWQRAVDRYTEKVYVLSCSMTLHLLREQPIDFQAMVLAHFRERAVVMLKDLSHYRQADIGTSVEMTGGLQLTVTRRCTTPLRMSSGFYVH